MTPFKREATPARNSKCPCGSGKKAKKCCLGQIKVLASIPEHLREQFVVDSILRRDPLLAMSVTTEEQV